MSENSYGNVLIYLVKQKCNTERKSSEINESDILTPEEKIKNNKMNMEKFDEIIQFHICCMNKHLNKRNMEE